jgi:hypothetical protein
VQYSSLPRILFYDVPNNFLRNFTAPSNACPADTTEYPSLRDPGRFQPTVNCLLNPSRHWHGPDVPSFANQVDDGPMIFATLEMVFRLPNPALKLPLPFSPFR